MCRSEKISPSRVKPASSANCSRLPRSACGDANAEGAGTLLKVRVGSTVTGHPPSRASKSAAFAASEYCRGRAPGVTDAAVGEGRVDTAAITASAAPRVASAMLSEARLAGGCDPGAAPSSEAAAPAAARAAANSAIMSTAVRPQLGPIWRHQGTAFHRPVWQSGLAEHEPLPAAAAHAADSTSVAVAASGLAADAAGAAALTAVTQLGTPHTAPSKYRCTARRTSSAGTTVAASGNARSRFRSHVCTTAGPGPPAAAASASVPLPPLACMRSVRAASNPSSSATLAPPAARMTGASRLLGSQMVYPQAW